MTKIRKVTPRKPLIALAPLLAVLMIADAAMARMGPAPKLRTDSSPPTRSVSAPAHGIVAHRVGRIVLGLCNNGTFGNNYSQSGTSDFFTGEAVPACEYPKNSNNKYIFGGTFWIGAVVGRDTLVSVGADSWQWVYEFNPDIPPFGYPVYRSIIDPQSSDYRDAVSEEDYVMVYTDTLTEGIPNDFYGRPHMPLNIEVTEASYAWSYAYAEDIILFDYQVKNIGTQTLHDVYMGILVDADVSFEALGNEGAQDDLCGFLHTMPAQFERCTYTDTVNIAWSADNDGDLDAALPTGQPVPHATAARIVRTPAKELDVSFNWWLCNTDATLDFGPREKPFRGRWKEDYRNFGTGGSGTPEGDANKYYVMRNREFDYDQAFTASIQATDSLWLLPIQDKAANWSDGLDTRYLLSFGPFDINAGEVLPLSFAYIGGENVHHVLHNAELNLPDHPEVFYRNLDFSDLGRNSRWASWIYDNPGVDTDGDGYLGEFILCPKDSLNPSLADTGWIKGDGVPDFRGASPPPAPDFWVNPSNGRLKVRFNGLHSETTRDVFSHTIDFEGYRIYIGRDARATSYATVASYDIENYNKLVRLGGNRWALTDEPFSLEELRCLYGDSCGDLSFNPLAYTPTTPYQHPWYDSTFYFEKQDFNVSVLGVTSPIRKRFPDQPYPSSLDPDSAHPWEVTEDGYLKYFEYEYEIADLLPSVPYWVNVTAFDFGSPQSGLPSLETSVTVGAVEACPLASWDEAHARDLKVYVWPNPYRVDGGYRTQGFEGRMDTDRPDDRVRAVHFANLPPKCTIRIYTLDGDLVREIAHDKPCTGPCATTDEWNLITRNTQLAVSGLYYWTVEDPNGNVQVGKLMLIM